VGRRVNLGCVFAAGELGEKMRPLDLQLDRRRLDGNPRFKAGQHVFLQKTRVRN
jgi:hypothetical protein